MIAYFPKFYEDELVYSTFSRFYVNNGYLSYIYVAKDLFVDKNARPDFEFVNQLNSEIKELITKNSDMETIILKHTMFPYYGRFMPKEKRLKAFEALVNMTGSYANLISIPLNKRGENRYLRYCPVCATEDRNNYGETYWHRNHQFVGVDICFKHKCKLINSNVLISAKASPNFISAEKEVNINADIIMSSDKREIELTEYITNVFQSNMDMNNDINVGKFLNSKLVGTKYLSVRGKQRNMFLLYKDFIAFYDNSSYDIIKLHRIQKIFSGYNNNIFEICQLAMFLGIPANEFKKIKLPDKTAEQLFEEKVKELHNSGVGYNKIGRMLGVSSTTVRTVVAEKTTTTIRNNKKGGKKPKNWKYIDKETLPFVKNAIEQLKGTDGERPKRVTNFAVSKLLGVHSKIFANLPKCLEEIRNNEDRQEVYWAKEVIWAVKKILEEGETLNWKHIRDLTNMRKSNFEKSLKFIDEIGDKEIGEIIKNKFSDF